MIRRKRPKAPPSYYNPIRNARVKEIEEWLSKPSNRTRRPLNLGPRYEDAEDAAGFITELSSCFDNKCPFCESLLDPAETEVFLYRPLYGALQERSGPASEHYYCWLMWEWSNLYPACESCVSWKGRLFPVANERVNIGVRVDYALKKEEPLLLDPCNHDPDQHLVFHEDGTVSPKPGSKHGEKTIEILGLNREGLQVKRKKEAARLKQAWEEEIHKASASPAEVKEILWQAYCLDDQSFAGMKRQLLTSWIGHKKGIEDSPADKQPPVTPKRKKERTVESKLLDIRPLRIFLCHSSGDKPVVRKLYRRLVDDGFDAWLDEQKLMPGQDWDLEIRKAVRNSDTVVVCLSKDSITKEGYVQKEIRFALAIADEKPAGTIFLIPARLEECEVPDQLSKLHWVNLFEDLGYEKLLGALRMHAEIKGLLWKRNDSAAEPEP